MSFFYRFSIIYFNYTHESPENFSSTKKVLQMLRNLEVSDAFMRFLAKTNRTYNGSLSFLPGKKLLSELLRNEGSELSMDLGQNYATSYTKEELISALFNGTGTLASPITSKQLDSPSIFKGMGNESMLNGLSINEAPLKKVFENYCAFGEPMNI